MALLRKEMEIKRERKAQKGRRVAGKLGHKLEVISGEHSKSSLLVSTSMIACVLFRFDVTCFTAFGVERVTF